MKLTAATITTRSAIESLRGIVCPFCGHPKRAMNSLCSADYFSLDSGLRRSLYAGVRQGYEQALAAALKDLEERHQPAPSEGVQP